MQKAIDEFKHASAKNWRSENGLSKNVNGTKSLNDFNKLLNTARRKSFWRNNDFHTWCTCHAMQSWRFTCLQWNRRRNINWYFVKAFLGIINDKGHGTWNSQSNISNSVLTYKRTWGDVNETLYPRQNVSTPVIFNSSDCISVSKEGLLSSIDSVESKSVSVFSLLSNGTLSCLAKDMHL